MFARFKDMFFRYRYYGYSQDILLLYKEELYRYNQLLIFGLSRQVARVSVLVALISIFVPVMRWALPLLFFLFFSCVVAHLLCRNSSRSRILWIAYGLCSVFYAIIIALNYSPRVANTTAFFCGLQMMLCMYVVDYPIRLILLNLLASLLYFGASIISPEPHDLSGDALCVSIFFFFSQMMLCNINHTRLSQIISTKEIARQRDTDGLTHLFTRSAAEKHISAALFRQDASVQSVLMLFDLDHFKELNDTLGHQVGDQALQDVATDLSHMFRASDILSRLGGDEFIIFLQNVPDRTWPLVRAQQVLRVVAREYGPVEHPCRITASLGIAFSTDAGMTYNQLYHAADHAMYKAKRAGGNRLCVWHPTDKGKG